MKKLLQLVPVLVIISSFLFTSCEDKMSLNDFKSGSGNSNIGGDTVYIQLSPNWTGFNKPQDILVGREPFIYVADTDNDRVVMLNLNGEVLGTKSFKKPIALAQDYQLNILVVAKFDTLIGSVTKTYSAVYKLNMVGANHQISNAAITRILPRPNNSSDLQFPDREYTGVCCLYDNSFLVSRKGPSNGITDPDNSILKFIRVAVPGGGYKDSLLERLPRIDPVGSGLLSANKVSSLTSLNKRNQDFILTLIGDNNFKAQWFTYVETAEFAGYRTNLSTGSSFYKVGKFGQPEGACIDNSGNIFIADAQKDTVYKFNSLGDELQSFGGPSVFKHPYAVAFFDRTLYVADTGNDRILRFTLSTEIR